MPNRLKHRFEQKETERTEKYFSVASIHSVHLNLALPAFQESNENSNYYCKTLDRIQP